MMLADVNYFWAKILGALVIALAIIFTLSSVTYSATATEELNAVCTGGAGDSAICQQRNTNDDPVKNILVDVVDILFYAVGALAVIMLIYGGFKYVKSDGDSGKVSEAKNTIIYALVGLAVAFLANRLIVFLLNSLL